MESTNKVAALYVVATPLGNIADITLRALETLRQVDLVACEDTRHTRRLLDHYDIRVRCCALHEHNEAATADKLIVWLGEGKSIALVSDAGTPAVSDPGARAVAAVRAAGFPVIPLPGPNAAIAALSAAGLDEGHFHFVGFLPSKPGARRQQVDALKSIAAALVFYEAPHRIVDTVADLAGILEPQRTLVVARELTKLFEQIEAMPLGDAPAWLAADANRQRGEFVLLVSAPPPGEGLAGDALRTLHLLLAELPLKQAVRLAADISGAAKNALYDAALAMKDGHS
ncbi:MAG: 16S rRNA (cytidine(1402)-2'-O)-methyltransferase [Sterolibacterium sp.]|nr:16S rRNA (cytidine(1402)-2'-O)-methyltransferase [Sterolibacterium sp.]MBP9799292.1 16S rRNA (cytidine(1402)-2'-O)-methyltransferase [Sterolibacterium sp.]